MCRDPFMTIVALEQTHSTNEKRSETMFYGGYDYQLVHDQATSW